MVREVVAIIQPLVEKNANTLEVHCEDSIGSIRADMTKVRQTLFNLLSNACKFTERGTITVDVSHQTEHGQDWVSFSVADTGIGMTPEQMGKLFQPFSQADASTTRQYGGTGLGLVLCRKFCQMMGGDITLESEYGSGSIFTCKLPTEVVKPADEPAPPEEPSTDIVKEGVSKVLVIDDDPLVHDMMKRLLSTERFHVESASDGEMGLRLARDLRPDIITLDVFMPGTDGWTVLALLKADPDLSSIPVIMITVEDNKNRGYILGTSEYMVKPIERDRLMSVLNRYRPDYLPCSVLVVEDNVEARRLMRRMLEREAWTVTEPENGRVGLSLLVESQPDIILLDLMMPEMDGFEFMDELVKHPEWRTIPVVVVTSKDISAEDRLRLNSYVEKIIQRGQYTREGLLEEVRRLVEDRVRKVASENPSS